MLPHTVAAQRTHARSGSMRRRASRCAFGADVLLTLVGPKGERLAEARPGERGTRARPHHPDRAHGLLLQPVHGLWRALKHWEIAAVDFLRVFALGLIILG